jgi:hypothetical protein
MADTGEVLPSATAAAAEKVLYGAPRVEATLKAIRALGMAREATAGAVTASVFNLYKGAVRAMMINRWITAGAWLLAVGITGAGAGAIAFAAVGLGGQEKAEPPKPKPQRSDYAPPARPENEPPVDMDSPETFRKQIETRLLAAGQRLEAQRAFYQEGRITIDRYIDASRQLMLAEMSANPSRAQRVAAAKAHWDRMTELLSREQKEFDIGRATIADVSEAIVARENAFFEYIETRQSRGATEVETLRQRIDTLEKQLESIKKQQALPATGQKQGGRIPTI